MCLILYKPASSKIPFEIFQNVILRNKDGFGIMYQNKQKHTIQIHKTQNCNVDEHWNIYKEHQDKDVVLHWRHRTEGDVSLENAHPFEVIKDKLYMVHNGAIHNKLPHTESDTNKNPSDTHIFIETLLKPLSNSTNLIDLIENSPQFRLMLASTIGNSNKLVFMTPDKIVPINHFETTDEKYVAEIQGLFYSNTYAWDNQNWLIKKPESFPNNFSRSFKPGQKHRNNRLTVVSEAPTQTLTQMKVSKILRTCYSS